LKCVGNERMGSGLCAKLDSGDMKKSGKAASHVSVSDCKTGVVDWRCLEDAGSS